MDEEDRPLSGQQKRKARLAKEEQDRRDEVVRRTGNRDHLSPYRAIGLPPEDPTQALVWAQRVMLTALYEVINDSVLTAPERWKLVADFGFKLGSTHSKTLVQSKLDKVTKTLTGKADIAGGPKRTHGLAKPATARGGNSREPSDTSSGLVSYSETCQDE